MNITRRMLGFERSTTPIVEARCVQCGNRRWFPVHDVAEQARAYIHHGCAHGAVGETWQITIPPASVPRARRRRT